MASKRVGDIYKITVDKDFYIGSTWDFNHRLANHKNFSTFKNSKLYIAIRHNNYQFDMVLLYNYECYTDTELRMEERKCYDELKPNLNMNRPYVSKEEKIEHAKQYNIKNRDTIKERKKQYNIKNSETIRKRKKQHRIENKETQKINRDNNRHKCCCGSMIRNYNSSIKIHEQSKKHQKYLLEM